MPEYTLLILRNTPLKPLMPSLPTGDLFTEAAEAAMAGMKGRLANQYYMKAEEAWALMEEWFWMHVFYRKKATGVNVSDW